MASTVDSTDPLYSQLDNALNAQKASIQNAFRRKGERPNLQPRAKCVNEYDMAALSTKMKGMQTG
jgi:hypothetical protein